MSGHILQSEEWAEFRKKTPNVKGILKVDGCQIFIHKIPCLPAGKAYLPWTVAYLPRPEKIDSLEEIKKACQKERAILLKIEPLVPSRVEGPHRIGSPVLPRHTIYIDLTKTEDQLLAAMHEKTRYNIRLAQKKGLVVKDEDGPEALENFIKLLTATEFRQQFYSHPAQYYRTLWQTLRPAKMVYLLSAYLPSSFQPQDPSSIIHHPSSPIASVMLFRFKDTLYYPYGGSDPKYREFMAPHLLHWEAIKLGKKLGCKVYDMWGSYKEAPLETDPWWGIYRFKKGFGGEEITFPPAIDIPLSPLYPLYPLLNKFRGLTRP